MRPLDSCSPTTRSPAETQQAPPDEERAACAARRERAWRLLFREQTLSAVQGWLRRLRVAEDDVLDAAQVVMLEAIKSFPTYAPGLGRPDRWLNRIAVNVASDFRRESSRRIEVLAEGDEEHDLADERPGADDVLGANGDRHLFYRALERVPSGLRLLLVRHDFEGIPMAAIAEMDRISVSTAYRRRSAALSAFRAALLELQESAET
jgi:RNA polymerase sigma-70 factor, ECF subfamily